MVSLNRRHYIAIEILIAEGDIEAIIQSAIFFQIFAIVCFVKQIMFYLSILCFIHSFPLSIYLERIVVFFPDVHLFDTVSGKISGSFYVDK